MGGSGPGQLEIYVCVCVEYVRHAALCPGSRVARPAWARVVSPHRAHPTEESRFPRLESARAGKQLALFTRAEVAKHNGPAGAPAGSEPYMIIHNKAGGGGKAAPLPRAKSRRCGGGSTESGSKTWACPEGRRMPAKGSCW